MLGSWRIADCDRESERRLLEGAGYDPDKRDEKRRAEHRDTMQTRSGAGTKGARPRSASAGATHGPRSGGASSHCRTGDGRSPRVRSAGESPVSTLVGWRSRDRHPEEYNR
ncbi:hypothetical protein GCM10009769_16200 [Curtobacterium luteum]|uniref:Uncharacterized protein n=1 Tax=Curtobacterium luteum TaxID=33881 RepID=A0A8H9G9I4_9MICO|nr:hypothetical protein GCM10009769_16200 [Curtobacterium luteum]